MSPQSWESKKIQAINQPVLPATCFMMVSCVAYSSPLKMKAKYSFWISSNFQRITRRHIPVKRIPITHRSEKLRSYMTVFHQSFTTTTPLDAHLPLYGNCNFQRSLMIATWRPFETAASGGGYVSFCWCFNVGSLDVAIRFRAAQTTFNASFAT
jgi:hypothetical protein